MGKQPQQAPRAPTKEELLLAQITGNPNSEMVEDMRDQMSSVSHDDYEAFNVTHETGKQLVMYKPLLTKDHKIKGYTRRLVPSHVLSLLISEGWRAYCPSCGTDCGGGPNDCPARDKVKFRRCQECGKKLYDMGSNPWHGDIEPEPDEDDEFEITTGTPIEDTPEARTLDALLTHYEAFHPAEMRRRGLTRPKPAVDQTNRGVVMGGSGGWTSQSEPVTD
jgi:hypothetical protein